ncbi:MAG: hypothetical protein RLZZ618_3618 [Pseudomonadota bacterium]|jgi:general secretion pathway protein F
MKVQLNVVRGRETPHSVDLEASNLEEARLQAAALGYTVLSVQGSSNAFKGWLTRRGSQQAIDLPIFVEQLRDLLEAGLSVIEALEALRRGASGTTRQTLERLERQLREGKTFSDALAGHTAFPPLLVALVRASELTSDLPQTLSRFLEHEQRVTEIRHRLVSTAIYPVLLMGVGALVLLFLMFYVMPRFARVFEGMTGTLPWSAQAMVSWSHLLRDHAAWWITSAAVLVAAVGAMASSIKVRAGLMRQLLSWGPLHQRLHTYFLSRWYRAVGMLVHGGIPLPQALTLANALLPLSLQARGLAVWQGVSNGLSPSAAHAQAGMATPVAEQLMLAGERTGDLGTVLTRIAHFHEAETTRTLERTMRALEPLVMVFIGVGVGLVVVLMYMPIFELAAAIQ